MGMTQGRDPVSIRFNNVLWGSLLGYLALGAATAQAQPDDNLRQVQPRAQGRGWRRQAEQIVAAVAPLPSRLAALGGSPRLPQTALTSTFGLRARLQAAGDDTQAPTPPSALRLSNVGCRAATLAWVAASDNVAVAFYDIFHDGQLMLSVPGTQLSAALTVSPGVNWGLYVNARDAAGNVSQASDTLPITPPQCLADLQAPTQPTALRGSVDGVRISLSWAAASDDAAVSAYDIRRNNVRVGTITGANGAAPATQFADEALRPLTTYSYTVFARDAQGNTSPVSQAISLRTGAACTGRICAVTPVTQDTDLPWGLVTLNDKSLLFSRRDAHNIVRFDPQTKKQVSLGMVPNVASTDGEGGLLGLAVFADFAASRWLYIMHTSPSDNRVVRMALQGEDYALNQTSHQVLLSGIQRNKFHNGGRLRVGGTGQLFVATGDAQNGAFAQDKNSLNGKVLRINRDGTTPSDNPFGNLVWTLGHRNPQGLAFDAQGRLWEQEFGNSAQDETNLLVKGGNYGWPDCEGTLSQSGGGCATPGFIAPKQTYPTALGSCSGITVLQDTLFVACQRGARIYSMDINGTELINQQVHFAGTYGRLRTIEPTRHRRGFFMTTSNAGDKDSIVNNSNETIYRVDLGT